MARQRPTKNPTSIVPMIAIRNSQIQMSKALTAQKTDSNIVNTSASCPLRTPFADCCFKAEWFYSCATQSNQSVCIGNISDGAWVGYPVSYELATIACRTIQENLANGQGTEFSASFDQNAFR
jgi:hypothetical protein